MIHQRLTAAALRIGLALLIYSSVGLLGASTASAATCTDGVDCYCDTVSDSKLLLCEDFESPDYYENSSADWVTTGGGSTNRGDKSRWASLYGNGISSSLFKSSDATPRIGPSCGYPYCTGMREYCSTAQGNLVDGKGADCWGPGVNSSAMLDFQRSGDYKAELSGLQLTESIAHTFGRRGMPIPEGTPVGLTEEFVITPERAAHWRAFVRRGRLPADLDLRSLLGPLRDFLMSPLAAVRDGVSFNAAWMPGGPWR